jgi:hypothetical protein
LEGGLSDASRSEASGVRAESKGGIRYGVLTALIAVAAPLTAAVHGIFAQTTELTIARVAKDRELELATREQDFKMRMEFLDRAIDVRRTPEDRQLVLRFLRAVSADQALQQWAEAELASVQQDVDTFKEAREQLARALEQESALDEKRGSSEVRSGGAERATADERADAERSVQRARARVQTLQRLRALELQTQSGTAPALEAADPAGPHELAPADATSKSK